MAGSRHHPQARPARVRRYDDAQAVHVLTTFGYKAVCECGYKGPVREKWVEASTDARAHNRTVDH